MEESDEDLKVESAPENEERESGSSSQATDAEMETRGKIEEEEVEDSKKMVLPQRILDLQRDLPAYVSNIQTEADAKEASRRKQQEEADRLRLEMLENDEKSSQERFEEITRGWSTAYQKATLWELQEVLKSQHTLCSGLKEDKKRRISEMQQELKAGDDHFVKDLKKKVDVLGLMIERIEDQTKTLLKTFREELANAERVSQQECGVSLLKDKTEWERHLKELKDKELAWLTQRQREMGEKNEEVQDKMLKTAESSALRLEINEKFMVFERECQKADTTDWLEGLKEMGDAILKTKDPALEKQQFVNSLNLEKELRNLLTQCCRQEKQFKERSRQLSDRYKRNIWQYEDTQEKIQHFAVADEKLFKQMWPMIDEEAKQLVETVLALDSLIWKQHLGLAWERPRAAFLEQTGPTQPQKQTQSPSRQVVSEALLSMRALQSGAMMDASVGPTLETDTEGVDKEEATVQSENGAEEEEGDLSDETLKTVMELLCDESGRHSRPYPSKHLGFLLDEEGLSLLAPMETEEQTVVKWGSLLSAFGIEEDDVPRLAHFLLKYKNQQREQTEGVCVESGGCSDKAEEAGTHVTSNHVLPALKSFLEQHVRSRENSTREHLSFQHEAVWDASEDEAYWESMGNIISEEKEEVWDTAENKIEQYHAGLMENSELITETQSLEQQNAMLRMLLFSHCCPDN